MQKLLAVLALATIGCGMPMPTGDAGDAAQGGGMLEGTYRGAPPDGADAGAYLLTIERRAASHLSARLAPDPTSGSPGGIDCDFPIDASGRVVRAPVVGMCLECSVESGGVVVSATGQVTATLATRCPSGATGTVTFTGQRR